MPLLDGLRIFDELSTRPKEAGGIVSQDLTALLAAKARALKAELNCVGLGTIVSFDALKQTAQVRFNYLRKRYDSVIVQYPVLVNCPVVVLGGGIGVLTFPIVAGDPCVILFCDRDIDTWLETGQYDAPNSNRMHDLNDGIVLVGIRPATSVVQNYATDAVELRHGTSKVVVKDDVEVSLIKSEDDELAVRTKVSIKIGGVSLKTKLDALCDAVRDAIMTDGSTLDPASKTVINNAKAGIGEVLE